MTAALLAVLFTWDRGAGILLGSISCLCMAAGWLDGRTQLRQALQRDAEEAAEARADAARAKQ